MSAAAAIASGFTSGFRSTALRSGSAALGRFAASFRSTALRGGSAALRGFFTAGLLAATVVAVLLEEALQEASLLRGTARITRRWFAGRSAALRRLAASFWSAALRGFRSAALRGFTTTIIVMAEQSGVRCRNAQTSNHQGGSQSHPLHYGPLLAKIVRFCFWWNSGVPSHVARTHILESNGRPDTSGNTANVFVKGKEPELRISN